MEDEDYSRLYKSMLDSYRMQAGIQKSGSGYPREAVQDAYESGCRTTRIKIVEDTVKFFKLEYSLGKNIMELMNSRDANDHIIAINMLISSAKDSIKNEVLSEINKTKE
jgi:hypothetical protein